MTDRQTDRQTQGDSNSSAGLRPVELKRNRRGDDRKSTATAKINKTEVGLCLVSRLFYGEIDKLERDF